MLNSPSQQYLEEPIDQVSNIPNVRKLRIYAFDPSLALRLDTAEIKAITFEIPWESNLQPGPIGEYIEVVDYDPASGCWYDPVDLNSINLLAQDGLTPSEGNPQYHQQMVYAVAMNTIANFEKALGRQVFWSPRDDENIRDQYVQRLRIYPHALRAANAYFTARRKKPCCLAIFRLQRVRFSPAYLTTLLLMKRRMRCWTGCIAAMLKIIILIHWLFMRLLPI